MGHRALVAYAGDDGRYELRYSHWGGADLALAGRLSSPEADPVADEPLATGLAFAAVLDRLDPLMHEALYVLDEEVRAYRTLWLGLGDAPADRGADGQGGSDSPEGPDDPDGPDAPEGLLVEVAWPAPCDDVRVRGWFAGARAVAVACRERGAISRSEAAVLVERCLRAWAGDREVVRLPAPGGA